MVSGLFFRLGIILLRCRFIQRRMRLVGEDLQEDTEVDIGQIMRNNAAWIQEKLDLDPDYFKKLALGQSPKVLYIGCSDSRITAEEMMGASPGDIFVHRNIANMMTGLDVNAMSVLHYAINALAVRDVIVCGHYGCGGIKAAMQSQDLGILNPWLREIRDVYRLHQDELEEISDPQLKHQRLVELNVEEQCVNIMKTAVVQRAYREGRIQVHGWVLDIHTGRLLDLKIDFNAILHRIMQIYRLD